MEDPKKNHPDRERPPLHNISALGENSGDKNKGKWNPTNFKVHFMIDSDIYCRTYLVEALHITNECTLYAMSVIQKESILATDEVNNMQIAKDVMQQASKQNFTFISHVHGAYQTPFHLILYMEFQQGGDLIQHLHRAAFTPERARFHMAEIVLAVKWLHSNGIIHRDMKLDHVLLDRDGHIKLSSFYFCKLNMSPATRTRTFCGTVEFLPPEMLLDKPYGMEVDWWSFGVIAYQMLTRQSPFKGEDEDEIYDAILAGEISLPNHLSEASKDFLRHLLARNPDERLGSGSNGAEDVMKHSFFEGVNWDDLYHQRTSPPFKPVVDSPIDVKYFDYTYGSQSLDPYPKPSRDLTEEEQEQFRGFSFSV